MALSHAASCSANGGVASSPKPKAKEVKLVDPLVAKRMAEDDMERRNKEAFFQVGCTNKSSSGGGRC